MRPTFHAYGSHRHQVADLFLPTGPDRCPVAVVIHGGFWRARYGRALMHDVCRDLAARGIAAWNVEYRRVGPPGPATGWPHTLEDVAAAVDALATVDAPLDAGRVVAVGHSAGGQLALWLAARPTLPPAAPGAGPRVTVGAAASQGGVCDLREAARLRLGDAAVQTFLGGGPADVPERYRLASPAERLPLGVPQMLVHGQDDGVVPPSLSVAYAERARRLGDEVELAVLPGVGHDEHRDPRSLAWRTAADWLVRRASP